MLEELGIGRPSTYAPTITTIINRRYVAKENKNLYMTELGEVVNNMMKEAFPSIVDVNFTATMEALLDRVGDGSVPWKTVVENFWPDLYEAVTEAEKNLEEVKVEDEVTDVICENCGRNMVVKYGPHGKFLACPGFPDCKNTKPYLEKIGVPCPKCGKEVNPAQDEKRTEILWMRKQSGIASFYVLAETVCQEMPAVRQKTACGQWKEQQNAGMSGQGMRLSGNSFQNIQCEMPEMP